MGELVESFILLLMVPDAAKYLLLPKMADFANIISCGYAMLTMPTTN